MASKHLQDTLSKLSSEAVDFYIGSKIGTIDLNTDKFSPLIFHRDFVAMNIPVKIQNGINHWAAMKHWNERSLSRILGDQQVTVAVTPNGLADAITDGVFMLPDEQTMTFTQFTEHLNDEQGAAYYIQKQNSNLNTELDKLWPDVDGDIPWATEALGFLPDAVNFWMGGHRSITSMHHDHYENIYCVVSGSKTFTLIPPTDQCYVPYQQVDVLRYKQLKDGTFTKVKDKDYTKIPWIPVNPLEPDLSTYPQFAKAHIYTVTVNAGEMLYLPSLWFHHVTQSDGCIAVNYWYDMKFDSKFVHHQFVRDLLGTRQPEETETTSDIIL